MNFDIKSFIEFDAKHNSIGTILVHPNNHPYDSDLLEMNGDNKITKVIPKPHNNGEFYQNLVNSAVYIFSNKIFDYIKSNQLQDLAKDILPKIIKENENLYGYKSAEYIKDMGTKDRFEDIKKDFQSGKVARLNKKYKRPCIFLDRDGVVNKNMDTSPSAEMFELLEGVTDAIKKINKSDYLSVIVTNQPMIAKGFVSFEEVENTHKKMESLLGEQQAFIDNIYFCPHHPQKGFEGEIKELKKECECRKPKSGMLLEATKDMNIELKKSWIVGDSESDLIAGKNIGCKSVFISEQHSPYADFYAKDLNEAIDLIMENS